MSNDYLPYDVSRCDGVEYEGEWREGCEDCLRRASPRGQRQSVMIPPAIIAFECEYRIEQRKGKA